MEREMADRWLERSILGTVLVMLVFAALATGAVRPQDFVVVQGLLVVATGLWIVRFWVNPSHRIQWTPPCWAVIAFVGYALVRYHQADVEYVARQESIRILVYAWLFFIVLNNLHRQQTTQVLVAVLLGVGMLIAVYAVAQFLTRSNHVWHFVKPPQYAGRGSGTFICPNHLAGFLELLVPLALAALFLSRARALARILYAYVALVMLAGIGVSISRGGWLATAVALAALFAVLIQYRQHRRTALGVLVAILVGLGLFLKKSDRPMKRLQDTLAEGQLDSGLVRPELWKAAGRMWRDHLWWGVGPAHFDVRYPAYRTQHVQSRPLWVHNDYLNALVDWGVAGGAIIGAFLVALAWGAGRTWKYVQRGTNDLNPKGSDRSAHVLGACASLLALLVHSVVDFNMQVPANAMLTVTLMASLSSHLRFATNRYWVRPHSMGRLLATLLGGLACYYLAAQTSQRHRELSLSLTSSRAETWREWVARLEAAHAVEPQNPDTTYSLGEAYRLQSWEGNDDWEALAAAAMRWFDLGMRLNPYDPYNPLRYGMCLDWLKRHAQADVFFTWAWRLDPKNYYVSALRGWHYLQAGDLAAARQWLEHSRELKAYDNQVANTYLTIVLERLAHRDTSPPSTPPAPDR
ncbi:MAG: hypothetical protein FJ387_02955 [Verrucomicrobia bacterium]|nr:hypothetical protein [Verrucomicrobiota bacterium]